MHFFEKKSFLKKTSNSDESVNHVQKFWRVSITTDFFDDDQPDYYLAILEGRSLWRHCSRKTGSRLLIEKWYLLRNGVKDDTKTRFFIRSNLLASPFVFFFSWCSMVCWLAGNMQLNDDDDDFDDEFDSRLFLSLFWAASATSWEPRKHASQAASGILSGKRCLFGADIRAH